MADEREPYYVVREYDPETSLKGPKREEGEWEYLLYSANHALLAVSEETYSSKSNAKRAVRDLKKSAWADIKDD